MNRKNIREALTLLGIVLFLGYAVWSGKQDKQDDALKKRERIERRQQDRAYKLHRSYDQLRKEGYEIFDANGEPMK